MNQYIRKCDCCKQRRYEKDGIFYCPPQYEWEDYGCVEDADAVPVQFWCISCKVHMRRVLRV